MSGLALFCHVASLTCQTGSREVDKALPHVLNTLMSLSVTGAPPGQDLLELLSCLLPLPRVHSLVQAVLGSVCPLEKCSSPSTVVSTGIFLFFFFSVGWELLEVAGWNSGFVFILHLVPCHFAPSPCDPIKCSSGAAALTLIIHRIVVTGWHWEPWLEPQPCGEGRDPSPAQPCVGLLPNLS